MQIVELLRSMDIFEELDEARLEEIAGLLEEQRVPAGTTLFREGDVGDSILIVTAGRIRLSTRDGAGRERTFAVFGDGEFFGEMGVLSGEPRTADATAEIDSGVLVVSKAEFEHFLASDPAVMRRMLKVIAQRQMQANIRLVEDEDEANITKKGGGLVLVVFGPRGGSGKTTIAVNLAVLLARMFPDRIALMDLSVTFSHAGLFLGLPVEEGIGSIEPERLENLDRETLNKYAYLHSSSLRLYVGATRPEDGEAVSGEHVKAALSLMKRQYLAVIVDLPSNFNEPTLAAIEMSDKLVLMMTPELSTMRDVREVLRLFNETIRVQRSKQYYLLNTPGSFRPLNREQFESHLELQVHADVPYGGEAAFKSYVKGEPLVMSHANSATIKVLEKVANELLDGVGRPIQAGTTSGGGLFRKLIKKKG